MKFFNSCWPFLGTKIIIFFVIESQLFFSVMANNRGKQKKKDNHELCGSGSLSCENDGDKALGCGGYCRRWFHVQCVDVKSLIDLINTLGDKFKWLCNLCDKRFDAVLNRQNDFTDMDMSNVLQIVLAEMEK